MLQLFLRHQGWPHVKLRILGRSGIRVSEFCLGTMTFGENWGWGSAKEECRRIFDAYVDFGGNFIDTADLYTQGSSETFLGEFISSHRSRLVVASKFTMSTDATNPNAGGSHRKNLTRALNSSLQRLRTDYLDLYWVHAWDRFTPVEETLRALDDAVRAGKILSVGFSDCPAWLTARASTIAELRGWSPLVAIQVEYSLAQRSTERELLPMAQSLGLSVLAWGVLRAGVLTGKYTEAGTLTEDGSSKRAVLFQGKIAERTTRIAQAVREVARSLGLPPSHVALAWLRQHSPQVIPIFGARTHAQFVENLQCLDRELPVESVGRLSEVSAIELGFPHDFLAKTQNIHGDSYERIRDEHQR